MLALVIVVIIVLMIILLFISWKYTKNHKNMKIYETELENSFPNWLIKGGEGFGISYDDESEKNKQIITFTNIVLDKLQINRDYRNYSIKMNKLPELINLAQKNFERFGTFEYRDKYCYIQQNIEPRFISDSLLDGLMIIENEDVNLVIGKNEVDTSKIGNKKNLQTELFKKTDHNRPFFIDKELEKIEIYDSFSIQNLNLKKSHVFIEFTYPNGLKKARVLDLYREIHEKTKEILNEVVGISKTYKIYNQVFIIRIDPSNFGNFNLFYKYLQDQKLVIFYNHECVKNNFDALRCAA